MKVQVVDQSASEPRLHRILYFIQYLRAMILNLIMVTLASVLYLIAGVEGIYFLAEDTLRGLQSQQEQLQNQGGVFGSAFVAVVGLLTVLITAGFFLWMYQAILKTWRLALRIQAIFLLLSVLFTPVWLWPQLSFSISHLPLPITVLLAFSGLILIAMVVDLLIALWGVARSPEPSSFQATLDPRLARSPWTYLNKLLDLPRTPLRNPRVALAYLLSFAAKLLLIASILYLITVGGIGNKVAQLMNGFEDENAGERLAQAALWAQRIPLILLLSALGLPAAGWLQALARRLGGLSVSDVVAAGKTGFLLYLRPFDLDEVILPRPKLPLLSRLISLRPFPGRIEDELFDVSDGYRHLIAIGRPEDSGAQAGGVAYRAYLQDSEWQEFVQDKIQRAECIVMLLKDTDGVQWELAQVLARDAASKTLFLFDPSAKDPAAWQSLSSHILPPFQDAGLVPPGFQFQEQSLGFCFADDTLIEIVNSHWSTTSYRTAFSSFLAQRFS